MTGLSASWKENIAGFIAALSAAIAVVALDLAQPLDLAINDRLVAIKRKTGPIPYAGPEVVVIGFDEDYLGGMPEPFALVHVHLARILMTLAEARPRVVGVDLTLPSKSFGFLAYRGRPELDFDIELTRGLAMLSKSVRVVFAVEWNPQRQRYDDVLPSFVAATQWSDEPLAGTTQGKDPRASVTVCRDGDGVVRRFPGGSCQPVAGMPSFATRVLEAMGQRTPDAGLVNFSIGAPIRYVPVSAVMTAHEAKDLPRLEQMFSDKVVIVAAILNYPDRLDLPVPLAAWEGETKSLPGALFHAQAIRTLAANALVSPLSWGVLLTMTVLLSLLWLLGGLAPKVAVGIAVIPATAVAAWLLISQNVFVPVATVSLAALTPLLLRLAWDVRKLSEERAFLGKAFRGSVSPKVLDGILSGRLDPRRRGGRVQVHVMFADIRGFTELSERTEPERVIRMLNAYLGEATEAIHRVNGTIDKFLGDGVLAVFGAPEPLADSWNAALQAARDLVGRVRRLNSEHADCRMTPIEVGIGIHAGDAIVGFVGSSERYEFTTIGDTVNVASRIQGLTSELGFPILATVDALPRGGRLPEGEGAPLGPQRIKGHTDIDVVGFAA